MSYIRPELPQFSTQLPPRCVEEAQRQMYSYYLSVFHPFYEPQSNCLGFKAVPGHTKDSNEAQGVPNS